MSEALYGGPVCHTMRPALLASTALHPQRLRSDTAGLIHDLYSSGSAVLRQFYCPIADVPADPPSLKRVPGSWLYGGWYYVSP